MAQTGNFFRKKAPSQIIIRVMRHSVVRWLELLMVMLFLEDIEERKSWQYSQDMFFE